MKSVFHKGELEAQCLAGVETMARRVGNGIHAEVPEGAQDFLSEQPFIVIGGAGQDGAVWCGILTGEPGFAIALDAHRVAIAALPLHDDPLYAMLTGPSAEIKIGMLAIEPHTRRRLRVNGIAEPKPEGFLLHVRQAYANCPKYIQARTIELVPTAPTVAAGRFGARLTQEQQLKITAADTFFIASANAESGADASHRGGLPGFVEVKDAETLLFPDYSGNMMFNTVGNLLADPHAGLLFVDWESGTTLQLTGEAEILWDAASAAHFPGAQRVIRFHVTAVIEIKKAIRAVMRPSSGLCAVCVPPSPSYRCQRYAFPRDRWLPG